MAHALLYISAVTTLLALVGFVVVLRIILSQPPAERDKKNLSEALKLLERIEEKNQETNTAIKKVSSQLSKK